MLNIKHFYFQSLIIFSLGLSNFSNANELNSNFDKPRYIEKFNLGKSEYTDASITKTCYIYDKIVLTEISDPGLIGNVKINVEELSNKKNNFKEICEKKDEKFKYKITPKGYFIGIFDNYIFTNGPDIYGHLDSFEIFKLSNNKIKLFFTGVRAYEKPFQIIKHENNRLGLKYWMNLKNSNNCLLFAPNQTKECWENLFKKNNFKDELNLQDCLKSFKINHPNMSQTEIEESLIQVFVHTEIPDLTNPKKIKLLNKNIMCFAAP